MDLGYLEWCRIKWYANLIPPSSGRLPYQCDGPVPKLIIVFYALAHPLPLVFHHVHRRNKICRRVCSLCFYFFWGWHPALRSDSFLRSRHCEDTLRQETTSVFVFLYNSVATKEYGMENNVDIGIITRGEEGIPGNWARAPKKKEK